MMALADLELGLYTRCDGCPAERIVDCNSVAEALELLEVDGWTHQHNKRLCPACSNAHARRARIWSDLIAEDDPQPDEDLDPLTVYVVTCEDCRIDGKYLCDSPRVAGNHFSDVGWTVIWGHVRCPDHTRNG